MTARADLLHCGLVGVVGVFMSDFVFDGITEQVEDMGLCFSLMRLNTAADTGPLLASTTSSIAFHMHVLYFAVIYLLVCAKRRVTVYRASPSNSGVHISHLFWSVPYGPLQFTKALGKKEGGGGWTQPGCQIS
jgi:hypothetical protein